jgi:polyisoprenoid-binding protein YceI
MIALLFSAYSSRPVGSEKYVIDTYGSIVTWKCSRVFADRGGHDGYVSLSKGELMIEKGQLVGGAIEVDMNTIADEFHRSDNKLISHLKSPDFFDVEKFPISTFVLTKVVPAAGDTINVTGNLTIKGITHEVTFPANVAVTERTVTANGNVTIDRTRWDVRYGSGKFFASLADKGISDDIEFHMKIVAENKHH